MRPIDKIKNEILTVEEWGYIVSRARRLLLLELLPEVGYDVSVMAKLKYSNEELKDRLVTQIRNLVSVGEDLLRANKQLEREKGKQAQILFDVVGDDPSRFK